MTSFAGAARTLVTMAAIACSAALLAGCGSSSSPAAAPSAGPNRPATAPGTSVNPGGPDQTVNPTATATPTAAGAPACATSALHVAVPATGSAAAGSSYYPVQFANTSSSPCTLYGYPGVSFVTAVGGSQIGIPATRNPALAARLVTLSPGQTVHAELQVADAQNYPPADCDLVTAHWLKVYPPNQTAPVYVSFTAQTCSKAKTILSVQTVQTGTSGA